MATTRRTSPRRFVLVVLVLASITVLTLAYRGSGTGFLESVRNDTRSVISPAVSALDKVGRPIANFFAGAADYGSLKAQNAKLRAEITKLEALDRGSSKIAAELSQENSLRALPWAANLPKITAGVLSDQASNFEEAIVLNKGSAQRIRVGMPVVAGGGLVGDVIEVSSQNSVVRLLTDPNFAVGVSIGVKGVLGVAAGQGSGANPQIEDVRPAAVVRNGGYVSTTQIQGTFPPGIPVGTVISAFTPPGALQQSITYRPFVDLSSLEFVVVLRWLPPPSS